MNRKQLRLVGGGALAILCLWLLASSISTISFKDGFFFYSSTDQTEAAPEAFSTQAAPAPDWLKLALFIVVWVLFPVSLIVAIFNPHMLKSALLRALGMCMWALVLIALTQVVNRLGDLFGGDAGQDGAQNPLVGDPSAFPAAETVVMPWWTQGLASLLAVCLVAWLMWRVRLYWLTARGRLTPELELALATQAGQAAADLRAGAPLREVILRCYQGMCQLLAAKQARPAESLTPREFEFQLSRAGIDDPAIGTLSRLFERVRYGAYQAVSEDERAALSCLEGIEHRYGGAA